jgi:hypothetical protein
MRAHAGPENRTGDRKRNRVQSTRTFIMRLIDCFTRFHLLTFIFQKHMIALFVIFVSVFFFFFLNIRFHSRLTLQTIQNVFYPSLPPLTGLELETGGLIVFFF